jgi:hypothetical protein
MSHLVGQPALIANYRDLGKNLAGFAMEPNRNGLMA